MFLQTACAVIHHPSDPKISLEKRLILDGGSQNSFVSERVCDLLHLETVGQQSLSSATFGSSKGNEKVCPIVRAGLHLRGYPPPPHVSNSLCDAHHL